jgi:hypothetical protein
MNDLAPEARERTCFAVASEVLADKGLRKRTMLTLSFVGHDPNLNSELVRGFYPPPLRHELARPDDSSGLRAHFGEQQKSLGM